MGNIGTLALGALLILGVLFIGYKMDTASEKAPVRKKQQVPKTQKKSKVKEEYIEETLEDIYDLDIPYESEENEFFTNDSINKYEEDDISLFGASEDVEFTFDNDIDDEISFELDKKYEEEVVVPVKKSKKRKEKVEKDDFSSTMIFDSEKLNDNSEEIDKEAYIETMDHVDEMVAMLDEFGKTESLLEEPDDYTEAVYGIDEKLKELDEDIESKTFVDGPIKPSADDAESFINELKKLKESAEADDFSGFVVDNKDKELKDIHKKYAKKNLKDDLPDIEIPKIPFTAEDNTDDMSENGAIDINFLAQMEENLRQTQKERVKQKKTPKRYTKKKDE